MKVKDMMNKNVVYCSPDDTLNKALAKMAAARIHQVVVKSGRHVIGVLDLKNVVTKNIDVSTAKVNSFIKHVPTISPDADVMEAAEMIIKTGIRALPVVSKDVIGVISESDMARLEKKHFGDYRLSDIMVECVCGHAKDDVDRIDSLMVRNNVSRMPIVDNDGVVGVVDTLDLIKSVTGDKRSDRHGGRLQEGGTKEKLKLKKIPISNFMHPAVIADKNTYLKDAIEKLSNSEEIVVEDDGKVYMVTPKDVLEIVVSLPQKGVYIQITNLEDESNETAAKIQQHAENFIKRVGKMVSGLQTLTMYIERHKKSGAKIKYSVRCKMPTSMGMFVSHKWDWDLIAASQDAVDALENEIMKKYGKTKYHKPRHKPQ